MIKITSTQQEQVLTSAQSHTPLIDFYLLSLGICQQEIFLFVFRTGNGRDLHRNDPGLVLALSAKYYSFQQIQTSSCSSLCVLLPPPHLCHIIIVFFSSKCANQIFIIYFRNDIVYGISMKGVKKEEYLPVYCKAVRFVFICLSKGRHIAVYSPSMRMYRYVNFLLPHP